MTKWVNLVRNVMKLIFLMLVLTTTTQVSAQAGLVIDRLEVDIWPEYDKPDVLVIYRITLPENTGLPVEMSMRVPAAAASPYHVAMKDMDGMLYNLSYDVMPEGEWVRITFIALSRETQIEFYDPSLLREGSTRSYAYSWPGDYTVNAFIAHVQQPLNAVSFIVEPDMGSGKVEVDNLTYYTLLVGQVEAGVQWGMHLMYDNPNNALSAELQPVQPVRPIPLQPEGSSTIMRWLIGGAGILGSLLILTGAFLFWHSSRKNRINLSRPQGEKQRPGAAKRQAGEGGMYCHECGKPAMSGDIYCRACGTRLRKD